MELEKDPTLKQREEQMANVDKKELNAIIELYYVGKCDAVLSRE